MFVVVTGNPFDGLTVEGPFDDHESALAYGEVQSDDWRVVPVQRPGVSPDWRERLERHHVGQLLDMMEEMGVTLPESFIIALHNGHKGAHDFLDELGTKLAGDEDVTEEDLA